jgi:hypothetical protein
MPINSKVQQKMITNEAAQSKISLQNVRKSAESPEASLNSESRLRLKSNLNARHSSSKPNF